MFEKTAIVIPAYNPSGSLLGLLEDLKRAGLSKVLVVDDGSTKSLATIEAVKNLEIDLITHSKNQGKGAALKSGYKHLLKKYGDKVQTIITVDADGQHLCRDVIQLAERAKLEPHKLILGVRDFQDSVPLRSALGNRLTSIILERAENISLRDTQTGLRALPSDFALESSKLPSDRYEFELESILLARKIGVSIEQVPISTVYIEENASSHFRPLVDSMRIYAVFARFIGVSFISFLVDIILFAVFYGATSQIFTSTYLARGVSATFNFFGNKIFVFKSIGKVRAIVEAAGYSCIVVLVATLSAFFITWLSKTVDANIIILKILVDATLFIGSFLSQKYILFRAPAKILKS